jgi:hypothetical protein
VRSLNLKVSVRKRRLLVYLIPLVGVVIAGFLWLRYDVASFTYSLDRLKFLWGLSGQSGISISVAPGDDEILAGRDLHIGATVTGFVREAPMLHVISDGEEMAFTMEKEDTVAARGTSLYGSTLARVDRDIAYYVTLEEEASRVYRISVQEEPKIKRGTIALDYPGYTGLGTETLPYGIWDISAPYGTVARMELVANCSPESAWVSVKDSTGTIREIAVTVLGDSLRLEKTLTEGFTYTIGMVTAGGLKAKPHGPYSVTVIEDRPPYVRIESPPKEILLEADLVIPLSVVALDDYGISSMRLYYSCPGETSSVALSYAGKTQARSDYNWDTGFLDVIPGDAINYYVTVADNDALTGPKYARTETYVARVPTLYDFYQDIEDDQDADMEDLEEIAEEAEMLKEDFEEIMEDIRRTDDVGWEEQQAIKQNLGQQDELRERLEEFEQSLDETLDRMGENPLVSFEVIEKLEEIRRLFEEIATEEMRQALKDLHEAMEELSTEELEAAMQNLNMSQEELLQRLDRTLEMMKRLRAQQKMEAAVSLAEHIAKGQEEVNEQLREGGDLGEAGEREQGLMQDTDALKDMMEALSEMLKEQQNPVAADIDRAGDFMESSGIGESMSMAMSSMSEGRRGEALEQGEKAQKSQSELASMLRGARDSMMGEDRRQIQEALTKAMYGLMDVSRKQEDLLRQVQDPEGGVPTTDLARMEVVYKEALDRIAEDLFEVSKKSLFVSPALGRAVLRMGKQLGSLSQLLSQGVRGRTKGEVKSSLGSLNQLITGIMDAMEQASSCSSPSGMCEAFQNLNNMCSMQMGINQGTQSMLDGGQQGLSEEARAQMARLAAQQETVRKGIEDLAQELGNRSEILGRFDDLVEEARQVVEDLRNRDVDRETIRRQERILTRLLNAQKSMRRRDYSDRRKSRPGEAYQPEPPPELSLEEAEEMVRDLIYQRRGYYPPEYEDLIRAYFRVISTRGARRRAD